MIIWNKVLTHSSLNLCSKCILFTVRDIEICFFRQMEGVSASHQSSAQDHHTHEVQTWSCHHWARHVCANVSDRKQRCSRIWQQEKWACLAYRQGYLRSTQWETFHLHSTIPNQYYNVPHIAIKYIKMAIKMAILEISFMIQNCEWSHKYTVQHFKMFLNNNSKQSSFIMRSNT